MRKVPLHIADNVPPIVHRVIFFDELAANWEPELRYLVLIEAEQMQRQVEALQLSGLDNVRWVFSDELEVADIVIPDAKTQRAFVLYRASDTHHSLLLTNRCNSFCIMCSQPPTRHDDSWLVNEALDVIRHIHTSPSVLGLSGGEPLLLGSGLRRILDALNFAHPTTKIEVLTNGRLFSNAALAKSILDGLQAKVYWLVPLYGHVDFYHDFVVQVYGAFEQTIAGLLTLQDYQQSVQLRVVLVKAVLESLDELSEFIGRNLPFVSEVALMACEPTGFALANREQCELDLGDWELMLIRSSKLLRRYSIPHLFMNAPLCALPSCLWMLAHKSISDWKNVYTAECTKCSVKGLCSGLFSWHEIGWKPARIRAIELGVL